MKRIYFTLTFLSAILLAGCGNKQNDSAADSQAVKVKVWTVAADSASESSRFSGTVEEENGTSLSFPVMGTVRSVHVNTGDRVSSGQLIATLDPQSMQSAFNAAQSTLKQAEDVYRRMKELHDKGSLPEIKWVEVQSKLEQARSMAEIAKKNLADCRLYAPFAGVIAEKTAEAGQNVMPGVPVAKLVTTRQLKVKIAVPEAEIAGVALKQKALVAVPALSGKTFEATVVEKGIVANPLSRSYEVKMRVEQADADLMPGMVTEVMLQASPKTTAAPCQIPAEIVQLDEHNQLFVWTAHQGKAHKQVIKAGEFTAHGVTVASGLTAGDKVIVEGQHKVCEGSKLDIQ